MKKLTTFILLATFQLATAQNLVQNGNFETYSGCPISISEFELATPWLNPADNLGGNGSPDYFNLCGTIISIQIPYNYTGFQYPRSGVGYAGIIMGVPNLDVHEYIEAPLTSPLIANACYRFQMYINLGNDMNWNTDNIGVYFSDTAVTGIQNIASLPFTPQILNPQGNYPDTAGWTAVTGYYTAVGGESYLIIGSFYNENDTLIQVNSNSWADYSYFLIDDVSLSLCVGIDEQESDVTIEVYPNPFTDKLNINTNGNDPLEFILYDAAGRKVLNKSITNSVTINTEQLARGIYTYEVLDESKVVKKGKIVK